MLVLGGGSDNNEEEISLIDDPSILSYILLVFGCILIGFANIWLRQLRTLNMWAPGFYSGVCCLILFGAISSFESILSGNYY